MIIQVSADRQFLDELTDSLITPSIPLTIAMPTRRRAREIVLQLMYENDLNQDQDLVLAEQFLRRRLLGKKSLIEFATGLWKNAFKHRREIDQALSAKATNWSLRRMAAIDRNILRLAAYEILKTDTPGRVVINEAVELAKRYGNHQSGQFVNGILDRILHQPAHDQAGDTSSSPQDTEGAPVEDLAQASISDMA